MQHAKILQVIPGLHTGGAEQTALDIGDAVVAEGWQSVVASAGGRMLERLTDGGSKHVEMPLDSKNPFVMWRNAARLVTLIESEGVNLIHARSRAPAWSALLAARRTGIPFVTTYHGSYNQKWRIKALYNSVMARADIVIANSQWTADLVASRNPWAKDRIRVIHRGTDYDVFKSASVSDERRDRLRHQWGIGENDITIVQLARLTGWKGQAVVIDAAARLVKDHKNLKFILAGDAQGRDDYLAMLQQKINHHGLEEHVVLPGHCDDPAAAMSVADLVLVASTQAEAFGRAAVEAGALERPVIVSRIGAVGETVLAEPEVNESERTGWKVEPGDPDQLAQAVRECLMMDSKQRHAIGSRARSHGKRHFSLQQMCNKTIAIYQGLLAQ